MSELDDVFPLVYDELRRLAAQHLGRERPNHTLQPTELVHETYMRLVSQHSVNWGDRVQFFGVASQMMRRILVNHALALRTEKRGGGTTIITLAPEHDTPHELEVDVLALDEALVTLASIDARQARVVELRFFGGLNIDETAQLLGISAATVKREWTTAKLWLRRTMTEP
jgi:RNA polymerase sigma factor (TIGR02999 family)